MAGTETIFRLHQGTGKGPWGITNLKFMQLSLIFADFKHEPVGGHLPFWRGDTRFHLEPLRTAPIFSFFV